MLASAVRAAAARSAPWWTAPRWTAPWWTATRQAAPRLAAPATTWKLGAAREREADEDEDEDVVAPLEAVAATPLLAVMVAVAALQLPEWAVLAMNRNARKPRAANRGSRPNCNANRRRRRLKAHRGW